MSHTYTPSHPTYKLTTTREGGMHLNRTELAELAYTAFAFISSLVLICLGLRLILALLVVMNPFTRGLTIVTDPLIMPFTTSFNDAHQMIQASTAAAFTSYYVIYWIVSLLNRFFRQPQSQPFRHGDLQHTTSSQV